MEDQISKQQSIVDQVIKDYSGTLQALADHDNKLFLRCSCGSETLHLEYDKPYGLDICIFKLACESNKLSWKRRFQWVWHILRTGNQYSDQIILSEESKEKLKEFLNTI